MTLRRLLGLLCCSAMAMQLMAADPESGASAASPAVSQAPTISVKQIEELRRRLRSSKSRLTSCRNPWPSSKPCSTTQ